MLEYHSFRIHHAVKIAGARVHGECQTPGACTGPRLEQAHDRVYADAKTGNNRAFMFIHPGILAIATLAFWLKPLWHFGYSHFGILAKATLAVWL